MKMYQAIIKNKSGVIISAPMTAAPSREQFEQDVVEWYMKQPELNPWIRVADKKAFSYEINEVSR